MFYSRVQITQTNCTIFGRFQLHKKTTVTFFFFFLLYLVIPRNQDVDRCRALNVIKVIVGVPKANRRIQQFSKI